MSFWTAYQQLVGESPGPVSAGTGPGSSLPEPGSNTAAVSVSAARLPPAAPQQISLSDCWDRGRRLLPSGKAGQVSRCREEKVPFAQWRCRPQVLHNLPRGLGEGCVASC